MTATDPDRLLSFDINILHLNAAIVSRIEAVI